MGLLKNLFVEEVPNEEEYDVGEVESYATETVDATLQSVNTETLISDIYAQNDLCDMGRSIFKVEDMINSLPKEMVTETKKTSILTILTSFGLSATDVGLDGENRMEVLSSVLSNIMNDGNTEIFAKQTEIENHKKEIERLEKEISDKQSEMKVSENIISNEVSRISGLVKFIGGAE